MVSALSPSLSQSVTTWLPGQSSHWACSPVGVATTCTPTAGRGDDRYKLFISTFQFSHFLLLSLSLSFFPVRFIESKQQEHGRRYFYPLPGQSVQWTSGEFLCPLCQSFSNSVLPLLPPICSSSSSPEAPRGDAGFSEWRELLDLAVELAESKNVLEGQERSPQGGGGGLGWR